MFIIAKNLDQIDMLSQALKRPKITGQTRRMASSASCFCSVLCHPGQFPRCRRCTRACDWRARHDF